MTLAFPPLSNSVFVLILRPKLFELCRFSLPLITDGDPVHVAVFTMFSYWLLKSFAARFVIVICLQVSY